MPRDRFHFYELAVTNADMLARFCRALHPAKPRTLREDFSGTAALARAWLSLSKDHRAIAVDHDAKILARAASPRLRTLATDVLRASARADIIAATNFPLGYFHTRTELLAYLTASRNRLTKHGLFLADLYGGPSALSPSTTRRTIREPSGQRFTYLWQQLDADPLTNLVHNAIHFRSENRAGKPITIRNAFTYHWRLWSIPELTDALHDAGFGSVEVHDRLGDAIDSDGNLYIPHPDPTHRLDTNWVVYLVART